MRKSRIGKHSPNERKALLGNVPRGVRIHIGGSEPSALPLRLTDSELESLRKSRLESYDHSMKRWAHLRHDGV